MHRKCERCGVPEQDTVEGFLAFNSNRLVCSDCNDDLDNEWVADTGGIHPIDTLCPAAHVLHGMSTR